MIQAVTVVRDQTGCFWHPDMPNFEEGDSDKFNAWIEAQGLELRRRDLEDEPNHPVHATYFEDGNPDLTEWDPAPPAGDGWFTLAIGDTEDGPQCYFVRSKLLPVMATWTVELNCECPKCKEDVDLLDYPDFWEGRKLKVAETCTSESRDVKVNCPKCDHEFLADLEY